MTFPKQTGTFSGTYGSQQVLYYLANYRLLFQICIRTKINTDSPHAEQNFQSI